MISISNIFNKTRKILSFLLLFSFGLQLLPDRLMDLFHQHEHTHECHPNQPGEFTIEKEHIHCKFPHLFFNEFDHEFFKFSFVQFHSNTVFRSNDIEPILTKRYQLQGRAPPFA